jgi:hypothetical protein
VNFPLVLRIPVHSPAISLTSRNPSGSQLADQLFLLFMVQLPIYCFIGTNVHQCPLWNEPQIGTRSPILSDVVTYGDIADLGMFFSSLPGCRGLVERYVCWLGPGHSSSRIRTSQGL